ncbi:hypothetical protein [Salipiger bermudensis]|uniref:hypothetical protein n=1 Tax=Salipiger bermudensis TaxID=344736 RepID=UPI0021BD3B35|nr:hypothetical protein [Salipiger bermudensis]
MTDKRKAEEAGLGPWFDAGRAEAPAPSGDWLARMEAMALEEQRAPAVAVMPERESRGVRLRDLLRVLGGWPAVAGLAAACAAGVWFGAVSPATFSDWTSVATVSDSYTTFEPASGFDVAMLGY